MKISIASLESHLRQLGNVDRSGKVENTIYEPSTPNEQAIWEKVREQLPSKLDCEILLEFLIQEVCIQSRLNLDHYVAYEQCDWLWELGDIVSLWMSACSRSACSRPTAGLLCMSLACSGLFLSQINSPLYKPVVGCAQLHVDLFEMAKTFVTSEGDSLLDVELLMMIQFYMIYSGMMEEMQLYHSMAFHLARRLELFDEGLASWSAISQDDRELRRRLGWMVVILTRCVYTTCSSH